MILITIVLLSCAHQKEIVKVNYELKPQKPKLKKLNWIQINKANKTYWALDKENIKKYIHNQKAIEKYIKQLETVFERKE